jgi:putative membrane protein
VNVLAAIPLLAPDEDWGHGWWPLWLVVWATLIGTVAWLVLKRRDNRRDPFDGARALLAERYARGELSAEEYRARLDELQRNSARRNR